MTSTYLPSDHHARAFNRNVNMLAQQEGSRLSGTVRTDGEVRGKYAYFDSIGQTGMVLRTSPYADTNYLTTPRLRRAALIADYEHPELNPTEEQLKTIYDINSPLARSSVNAAGVTKDQIILAALGGSALEDETGSASVSLPSTQKVLHQSAGLTYEKVKEANAILRGNAASGELHWVIDAQLEEQLLGEVEATSGDYTKRMIIDNGGTINGVRWMGGMWHVMPTATGATLANDGSGNRLCYAYMSECVGLCIARDIYTSIDKVPTKSNAVQILTKLHAGAVRIDDKGIVEVACVVS